MSRKLGGKRGLKQRAWKQQCRPWCLPLWDCACLRLTLHHVGQFVRVWRFR